MLRARRRTSDRDVRSRHTALGRDPAFGVAAVRSCRGEQARALDVGRSAQSEHQGIGTADILEASRKHVFVIYDFRRYQKRTVERAAAWLPRVRTSSA